MPLRPWRRIACPVRLGVCGLGGRRTVPPTTVPATPGATSLQTVYKFSRSARGAEIWDNPGVEPNAGQNGRSWEIPSGVKLAHGVDLAAEDPAAVGGRRRCVALTKAGERCPTTCPTDSILCAVHAGRLDPRRGGQARAQ